MGFDRFSKWVTMLANIGVVAGIIFLAVEVHQNNTALEQNTAVSTAQAVFQINNQLEPSYRILAQNSVMAELLAKGHENPDSLSKIEADQFSYWMRATINAHEASYFYYVNGIIKEEDFGGYINAFCARITTNGGRWWWENNSKYFADGFRSSTQDWCY